MQKLKILFATKGCIPFHGQTLNERPLGGTETSVIKFAEALYHLGHDVRVLTDIDNPPLTPVIYLPYSALDMIGSVDILIAVRDWHSLFFPVRAKLRMFWTGDSYDQFHSIGIGDSRVADAMDILLTVSRWHTLTLCAHSGFSPEKALILGNGIDPSLYIGNEKRHPKRIFYSSTPYRGLQYIPEIITKLRYYHPDLEVKIFSGYKVYAGARIPKHEIDNYKKLCEELTLIPGVSVVGNIKQKELAREMMQCRVLAYPNNFEETFCITAVEARAAGCAVVTSAKGALPEVVGEGGSLIEGEPGEYAYTDKFVKAVRRYLEDDGVFKEVSERNKREVAAVYSWEKVAERFLERVNSNSLLMSKISRLEGVSV
jgi:glycosyltransferase involved in cell wall biosynthesis